MQRVAGIGDAGILRRAGLVVAVLALGVVSGVAAWAISSNPNVGLTIVLLIVTPAPIYVRIFQKRFDPFEPIQIIALTLFILFALRPAAELIDNVTFFANKQMRPGFGGAAVIALVGTVATYLGYASGGGRRFAARWRPLPEMWDARRSVRFAVKVLAVSALLTAMFGATIGFSTLFHFYTAGRTDTDQATFLTVSGYVGLGPYLTIPAAFILIVAWMRLRTPGVALLALLSVGAALFFTVPRGDRTYILVLLLPLLALPYLRKGTRPSAAAALGAVFIAILGMNILLATRYSGSRQAHGVGGTIERALTQPAEQFKQFATGVDLGEFSVLQLEYLATQRKATPLAFHPGSTVASLALYWLPRKIVHHKQSAGGEFVVHYLFPVADPNTQRASFNPSWYGDFYGDYGLIAVALYCGLLGIAIRALWEYFLVHKHSEGMQIVFAATLPMLVVMIRNNLTDSVGRSLYQIFPLVLCLIVCSREPVRRFAGFRARPRASQIG
jgi:hypothetical protein